MLDAGDLSPRVCPGQPLAVLPEPDRSQLADSAMILSWTSLRLIAAPITITEKPGFSGAAGNAC